MAGCISRTATAPLDRIKVVWQALGGKAVQSGVLGSLRKMLNEGGFTSLWRGNGINCIKIAPETALKFQTYEAIKKLICADRVSGGHLYEFTLSEKFVAGALAGAFSQSIIYPMEASLQKFF
ncbi:unnamed protein product [Protopolystoma xenopodis]|uniref:ADP/ATP translocase n=1 Tax=Protopolystoma xenopodis TaxID=117903 RepID=A0A3S5AG19_9PLAT|nr:unnamed protein product [Protopolystoma xenopodis]